MATSCALQVQDPVLAAALRSGAPAAAPSQSQLGALVEYRGGSDALAQPAPSSAAVRREGRAIRSGWVGCTSQPKPVWNLATCLDRR